MAHDDFDLTTLLMADSGMDSFLGEPAEPVDFRVAEAATQDVIRVASVRQLQGFRRVANDTLVRKSENDMWKLRQSEDGDWVVERLFDANGDPLKAV